MPSPFPGMDPYLEAYWEDVHIALIMYGRDALKPLLPPNLVVRTEHRVYVQSDDDPVPRTLRADVAVRHDAAAPHRTPREDGGGVATLPEPIVIPLLTEPRREPFIEVRDEAGRVITVIEVISPTNKRAGEGHEAYKQKQRLLLDSDISLVEIELVRAGPSAVMLPPSRRPGAPPYCVCVKRGWDRLNAEYYPISLRERLPAIRVPLRQADEDVRLDLQPLVDRAYEFGTYDTIDYSQPCQPSLTGDDAVWADALLRAAGRR